MDGRECWAIPSPEKDMIGRGRVRRKGDGKGGFGSHFGDAERVTPPDA